MACSSAASVTPSVADFAKQLRRNAGQSYRRPAIDGTPTTSSPPTHAPTAAGATADRHGRVGAGRAITGFISAKAQALFFYLAATARPHTREALAGLLWGGMPEAQASKNLRDDLTITREEAAFKRDADYWLGIEAFRAALTETASRGLEPSSGGCHIGCPSFP